MWGISIILSKNRYNQDKSRCDCKPPIVLIESNCRMKQDIYSRMTWLTSDQQNYLRQNERHTIGYHGWLDFEMFSAFIDHIAPVDKTTFSLRFGQFFQSVIQMGILPLLAEDVTAIQTYIVEAHKWSYQAKEQFPQIYPAILWRFRQQLDSATRTLLDIDALLQRLPYQNDADIEQFIAALPTSRYHAYRPPVGTEIVQRLIRFVEDEM